MYYTYLLREPNTLVPFYAGKGKGKRCYYHQKYKSSHDCKWNKRLGSFIGDLNEKGLQYVVEIIAENLTEDQALDLEEAQIKKWGRKNIDPNGVLLNFIGHKGESTITRPPVSAETRKKLSKLHTGRKATQEAILNMQVAAVERIKSQKQTGKWQEVVEKNRLAHVGKAQSTETIQKRNESVQAYKDANGGKRTFSETARKNIGDAQRGTAKNAQTWKITAIDGTCQIIKNLSKWLSENSLVTTRNKTGIREPAKPGVVKPILFSLERLQ